MTNQMLNFRERIINEFKSKELYFFRETLWRSALQQKDLPKIRNFLEKNDFSNIDVSLAIPQDNSTEIIKWSRHYDSSGQCIVTNSQVSIPAGANHLKLTFGYPSKEIREAKEPQTLVLLNSLRMIFGVTIARELILTSYFDALGNETTFSEIGFASPFDNQNINLFHEPPIENSKIIEIPEEAAFLLEKAFNANFPKERFVLMWLAFEIIINSIIKEGSNGKKREKFFKETLKSEVANNEVLRLFKLRCNIFKEGKFTTKQIENDCWSLYSAIQIAILEHSDQRNAFLNGYEEAIRNNFNEIT